MSKSWQVNLAHIRSNLGPIKGDHLDYYSVPGKTVLVDPVGRSSLWYV